MTTVFLLTDGTFNIRTWPDPGNWNPVNKVECIGAGGRGGRPFTEGVGGGGGGGGAYAVGNNLVLTFPVPYYVAPGNGGAANFNVNTTAASTQPGCVSAAGGTTPSFGTAPGNGGAAGFPAGFAGGSGGSGDGDTYLSGSGGGAAGPHGAGSIGGGTTGTLYGGAGDAGNTPGSAANSPGNNGAQFDAIHGSGSGGSRPPSMGAISYAGGRYGGGSGGTSASGGGPIPPAGGDGLIVITYIPFVAPPAAQIAMMA